MPQIRINKEVIFHDPVNLNSYFNLINYSFFYNYKTSTMMTVKLIFFCFKVHLIWVIILNSLLQNLVDNIL